MCLIAFALNQHADYPLILIANRDEFFHRPTQPLHIWPDHPQIIAGRDREAGGTWLGMNRNGRWAALTNFRAAETVPGNTSRGQIVLDALEFSGNLYSWLQQLAQQQDQYSGFNLVIGDTNAQECFFFSNRDPRIRPLSGGIYALSNGPFEHQWPKMTRLRSGLQQIIQDPVFCTEKVMALLQDPELAQPKSLPKTGIAFDLEHRLSSPFIPPFNLGERLYGTRSSLVVTRDHADEVRMIEHSYNAQGVTDSVEEIRFSQQWKPKI